MAALVESGDHTRRRGEAFKKGTRQPRLVRYLIARTSFFKFNSFFFFTNQLALYIGQHTRLSIRCVASTEKTL